MKDGGIREEEVMRESQKKKTKLRGGVGGRRGVWRITQVDGGVGGVCVRGERDLGWSYGWTGG